MQYVHKIYDLISLIIFLKLSFDLNFNSFLLTKVLKKVIVFNFSIINNNNKLIKIITHPKYIKLVGQGNY